MLLETKNVSKSFTTYKRLGLFKREKEIVHAVKPFDLIIDKPMIYGLVGPNGAGKTTFIKLCLGLVAKSGGSISVLGYDPYLKNHTFLRQVGLVSGQKQTLDPNLPSLDILRRNGYFYDMQPSYVDQRINHLVDVFGVKDKLHTQVRQLSLGQRMKFEIISSVLHEPKFLFMDEPTLGLDFAAQNAMRTLLRELHTHMGLTILLTSHYLPDITLLCEKVAVIEKGKKIFDGTIAELTHEAHKEGYLRTLVEELNKQNLVEE